MAKAGISEILKRRAEENAAGAGSEDSSADYDALFGLGGGRPEFNVTTKLPLSRLVPYGKHPFRPYANEELLALAASIREHGLQHPIVIRPRGDGKYEILSGHNRVRAFEMNGEKQIPAVTVNADDCRAAMIVTETNLRQRKKLLPSEKAFAYKLQLDAIKHQGKKTVFETVEVSNDAGLATSAQIARKSESAQKLANEHAVSKDEIRRYIRLTFLIPGLLALVDENKIPLIAGVELSYLHETGQEAVLRYLCAGKGRKPNIEAARALRAWAEEKRPLVNAEDVGKCLEERMPRKKAESKNTITFKRRTFAPYLNRIPQGTDLESLFAEFLKERFG
jgi:ParB family chromosome partitioning protein